MTRLVIRVLIAAFVLSFPVLSGSAMAQTVKKPAAAQGPVFTGDLPTDIKNGFKGDPATGVQLTGNAQKDMQAIVKKIQDLGRADLDYAILKAKAANTNGSAVRLQCLQAILAAKNAAEGTDIKDAQGNVIPRPDPAVVTTMEDVAELVDAMSPQGPLMTGCAGAAQLFKTNTLAMVNAIITGAVGIAALPAGL